MRKREDNHGKREEVALGGNDCSGPQELLAQAPLEASGTCRRFVCSRLAATEARSPGWKRYGGRGTWGRRCSVRHPCHRHFKVVVSEGS